MPLPKANSLLSDRLISTPGVVNLMPRRTDGLRDIEDFQDLINIEPTIENFPLVVRLLARRMKITTQMCYAVY